MCLLTLADDQVQGIAIAAEILVDGFSCLQENVKLAVCVLTQYTMFVKVVFRQSSENIVRCSPESYFHASLTFIVNIDGTVGGRFAMYFLSLFPYPQLDRFKMLASAQLRSLEIHARAVVPHAVFSSIHHLIFVSCRGIAHPVFAGTMLLVNHADGKNLLFCLLLTQSHLPLFECHGLRLYDIVQLGHYNLRLLVF